MKKHKVIIVGEFLCSSGPIWGCLSEERFSVTRFSIPEKEFFPLLLEDLPDAILLELSSVSASRGITLARGAKKYVDVPVVILTTEENAPSLEHMKELNIAACIYQPFGVQQLEVALELAIHQQLCEKSEDAYQELEKIGYSLSHTFRGPVASILGLTNICKLDVKDEKARWINEMIAKKAIQIDALLANYFHYLQLRTYKSVALKRFCWEKFIAERLAEGNFKNKNEQQMPSIHLNVKNDYFTDPFLLTLVFDHILKNTLDYRRKQPAMVSIIVEEKEDFFEVKISDNGMGMCETIQKKCFELFYRGTERSVGNGIGLNLVRTAMEKLGGSITIESIEDKGSCFTLLLPNLKVPEKPDTWPAYSSEIL